jgi:hypothetical protein
MTLKELNKQIKTKTKDIFEQVFPTLKARLSAEGLSDSEIRDFTVFERIKETIETHLVTNVLSVRYERNADQIEFWESEIKDIIFEVELRSTFLYAEEAEFFARISHDGILMNEGWVVGDCIYVSKEADVIDYLRSMQSPHEAFLTDTELKEKYFANGDYYYTEWHEPSDISWVKYNGNILPINN